MKSICLAIALALCLIAPAAAQDYRPLDWHEVDPISSGATAFFSDNLFILKSSDSALHQAYLAKVDHPNGPLTFAMWVGARHL